VVWSTPQSRLPSTPTTHEELKLYGHTTFQN
jgi:hypothetical protein